MGYAKPIDDLVVGDVVVTDGAWDRVHSVRVVDDGLVLVDSDAHQNRPEAPVSMVTIVGMRS